MQTADSMPLVRGGNDAVELLVRALDCLARAAPDIPSVCVGDPEQSAELLTVVLGNGFNAPREFGYVGLLAEIEISEVHSARQLDNLTARACRHRSADRNSSYDRRFHDDGIFGLRCRRFIRDRGRGEE
jgi:hypothetical protein